MRNIYVQSEIASNGIGVKKERRLAIGLGAYDGILRMPCSSIRSLM